MTYNELVDTNIDINTALYDAENEDLLVSEIYNEGIFNNFNRFCSTNNIKHMRDLKGFNFNKLIELKGFGAGRVERIKVKYISTMYSRLHSITSENNSDEEISNCSIVAEEIKCLSIEDAFDGNRFIIFRNFCMEQGFNTVGCLTVFDFDLLIHVDGIGVGKINQVRDHYNELLGNVSTLKHLTTDTLKIEPQNTIHNDYNSISISFAFDEKVSRELCERGILTISDLSKVVPKDFRSIPAFGEKRICEAMEKVRLFELPIADYVSRSFAEIRHHNHYPFYSEVVYKKQTLECVGQKYNLTRESVRQKKKTIEELAFPVVALFEEVVIRGGLFDDIATFDFEVFVTLIGSYNDAAFAKDIIVNCEMKHIYYSQELNLFFIDNKPKDVLDTISNIANDLGDIISFEDKMIEIEELLTLHSLSFVDVFSFPIYLEYLGYKKYKEYYIKGRASNALMVEIIMQNHFVAGIENTTEDIALLRTLLSREFGLSVDEETNDRNLWVLLERPGSNTVLWGKSCKIHINHVVANEDVLSNIKECIYSELDIVPRISADYIFAQFKDDLKKTGSNIDNKEALYGVLQYYFADVFAFKKLSIKKSSSDTNIQRILEEYMLENNGVVSMVDVNEHFSKWTPAMINVAINFNSNILSWDNGEKLILASTLKYNDDFQDKLKIKVENSFIEGYTNGYMVADAARVLLLKNKIPDDYVSAYSLAKLFFADEYFFTRRPHILRHQTDRQFTVLDLVVKLFDNAKLLSYTSMKERLINDFCFGITMAGNSIAKAAPHLFQVDIDRFCLPQSVSYSQEECIACHSYLNDLIVDKSYAVLSDIDKTDIYKHFIVVDGKAHSINAYSLKAIIEKEYAGMFRFIVRKNNDWRYGATVVVPQDSPIQNFADALIYILEHEYTDIANFTLANIENFMREKSLIYNEIPDEFFNSARIAIDELGRVTIGKEA